MSFTPVISRLGLEGRVLAQANTALPLSALGRIAEHAGGVAVCDQAGLRTAGKLRTLGYTGPLVIDLLDAAWRSDDASARPSVWHRALQLPPDITLITPSRRIPPKDTGQLDQQIAEGLGHILLRDPRSPSILGLALDHRWLQDVSATERLHERVQQCPAPIAVAFACTHDPLGTREAVEALRHILVAGDVALMRSDLAAAGAVAHGALFGAVGLTSSVRHLPVPLRRSANSAPPARRGPHVLVPGALTWIEGARLWRTGQHDDLYCACEAHPHGEWLGRYRDPAYKVEALLHNFYTWLPLAERLYATSSAERLLEWGCICREAHETQEHLESATGVSFSKQPLRWWTAL